MRWLLCLVVPLLRAQSSSLYDYFPTGDTSDRTPKTQAGLLLAGGGGDVTEAFRWFLQKAGNGNIVVLRASGADGYNRFLQEISPAASIETFVTKSREAAYDRFLLQRVEQAEGILLAGGDQWNYIRLWKGTPLQAALHRHYRRGRPLGGTSAGLAVLGEFAFSAEHDTVTSEDALQNPFHRRVTIEADFLRLAPLRSVITDSHFNRRDRMGRLLVFLSRIRQAGRSPAKGIGIDEATAVLVEAEGRAVVAGKANAYFVSIGGTPSQCLAGRPLSVANVSVRKVVPGRRFDVRRWLGGESYLLSVQEGRMRTERGVY